jgi:hypothetical protein
VIHTETAFSKGIVEFIEIPGAFSELVQEMAQHYPGQLEAFLERNAFRRFSKGNLVFNYPRVQYAKLDRGETPDAINASWFTLSNDAYTNPATETVTGESLRVSTSTKAVDPSNSKNSIIRFILDVGQFVGSWQTAILIGGASATSTPGTGKIIAAVNDVRDDSNAPLNRDGTTIHLVNWKFKHLDSSEV